MNRILLLLLLFAFAAPAAHGALINPQPFEAETTYAQGFDAINSVVSGAVSGRSTNAINGTVWLGADAFGVTGLERLYWEDDQGDVRFLSGTNLSIEVGDESSVAFRHPGEYHVNFDAPYALSILADVSSMFGESGNEQLGLGPAILAIPVDGVTTLPNMGELPPTPLTFQTKFNDFVDESALLLSFTQQSRFVLRDDNGAMVDQLDGNGRWVGFQGTPVFSDVYAKMVAFPTPEGATVDFEPGAEEDAATGLSASHLDRALGALAASEGQADAQMVADLQEITDGIAPLLNGAYIELDLDNATGGAADLLAALTIVRFESLSMTRSDPVIEMEGDAIMQIQSGSVVGARPLVGIFPWWSLMLWAIALGALVLRTVMKPDKHHPVWDKLGWVGWVGGFLASALVFLLWDLETRALWGSSVLSGGGETAVALMAVLQIVPLLLAGIAIGWPARILIKSGTRLLGQGNLMRIGAIIAPFAVLLLGAHLLIDYLELMLRLLEQAPLPGTS